MKNKRSKSDKNENTSWGGVAGWYDDLLEKESSTYQREVILPNLIRIIDPKKDEKILDLACGQGFFGREFKKMGAKVLGVDISKELIEIARKKSKDIDFFVSPADDLNFIEDNSIDKIVIVLALQNIENMAGVFKESKRVLKSGGKIYMVLNHPTFRIPRSSSWGWDEKEEIQYRRIDAYMSESRAEIRMHPGEKPSEITISFHRPLQLYFKSLKKFGFAVSGLEEWISPKKSEPGPRAKAENLARKEIPLFLMLETTKIN